MKASSIMVFEYMGMLGVPVLLLALAVFALVPVGGVARTVLLLLIGAGCLVYGAISVREVYIHGGKKRETAAR
ncbi:MAG: hypothetical protein ABSG85_03600 [Spirochaetia bacterium]|jgi:hypothetical protein